MTGPPKIGKSSDSLTDALKAGAEKEQGIVRGCTGKTIAWARLDDPLLVIRFTDGTVLRVESSEWLVVGDTLAEDPK